MSDPRSLRRRLRLMLHDMPVVPAPDLARACSDTDARPQGVTHSLFSTSAAKENLYALPRPSGSQASSTADANKY
jgi:hypothetical protein